MKYRDTNSAILNGKDTESLSVRSGQFYKYLTDNNVAYYYARKVSAAKRAVEKRMIREGENYNRKFFKTLKQVDKVCKKNEIDYLVFKTFKYIPEVYSGDLDIIIKEKDFGRILKLFKTRGFSARYDVAKKVEFQKAGYSKIEFRVNVEYHGIVLYESTEIWKYREKTKLGGLQIFKTTKEFDLACLLLNILYGPKYLDLYLALLYKEVGKTNLLRFIRGDKPPEDLILIINMLIAEDFGNKRFPLFVSNSIYLRWWAKKILLSNKVSFLEKFKVIAFFYYIKYKYMYFGNLQYAHKWLESSLL